MVDIKIREGSLDLWLNNQPPLSDKYHSPGDAVHIRFYDSSGSPIANYVFINGQLKGGVKWVLQADDIDLMMKRESLPEEPQKES